MGYASHCCSNGACPHRKKVCFSCKSRFCPTCGKKATDQWIATQTARLPQTRWQHITLTMPSALWEVFRLNRALLKAPSRLAAGIIEKTAARKGILPGIFTALHTFGRDLQWNRACPSERDLRGLNARRRAVEVDVFREGTGHADVALRNRRSVAAVARRAGSAAGAENAVPGKSGVEPLAGWSLRQAMDRPFCATVGQPYPQRELPWPIHQTPAAAAVEAEALRRLSTVEVGQSADPALDSGKLFWGHGARPAFHHPGCSGPSRSTKRVHMAVDRLRQLLAVRVTLGKEQRRAQVRELARQVQQATGQTLKVAFADHGYTGEESAQAALDEVH
ncbi:transposase [Paraburkholderia youngii]